MPEKSTRTRDALIGVGFGLLNVLLLAAALALVVDAAASPKRPPLPAPPPLSAEIIRVSAVVSEARRAGVPWDLAVAVSRWEVTNADSMARGRAGEVGYFQVMPDLWATKFPECYPERPLYNPERNACIGVRILRYHYERSGSWRTALLKFNGSLQFPESGARYLKGVARQRVAVTDGTSHVEAAHE